MTLRHCIAVATIAGGGREVIFDKGSAITSRQNGKGLRR